MKFLIYLAFLQTTLAEYYSDSPCPVRPVQQNFDIKKIVGRWYTVMKYDDAYGSSLTCGYGTYYPIDDSSVKVIDCELSQGKYSCLTGIISLEDSSTVPLSGRTSYAYFDNPKQKVDSFKYLSTDYDNYAIVYECKEKQDGKSIHYLWVSSRAPIMSDSTKKTVDEIIGNYFDRNSINSIDQKADICDPRT
ncbi:apolipoprotein D-like [Chironomus tepperi]|uniref:apolipoprotein D-like n=1 Tax=Chironomus tepperi TaxID=113505 RepID=UPI00391F7A34